VVIIRFASYYFVNARAPRQIAEAAQVRAGD